MKTLLIIDIQNDFLPGGALAVREGDQIVPIVNALLPKFELIVATQDWHPANHGSFAANQPGKKPFDEGELDGLAQRFWPVHCVQNTGGALFAPGLDTRRVERVFPKGTSPRIDSYSGFFDNGHRATTGLSDWLRGKGVKELTVVGLATDYCVKFSVLDALKLGFRVSVQSDACRGVNLKPDDSARALDEMKAAGATIIA
jgi:nicotinamidase/pyrazinamidase